MVRVRVNQHFFRAALFAAYDYKCCINGLAVPELLVASHIVPWASNAKQRMNPRNSLCLNALHDRVFDRRLMFSDHDLEIRSRHLYLSNGMKPACSKCWSPSEHPKFPRLSSPRMRYNP